MSTNSFVHVLRIEVEKGTVVVVLLALLPLVLASIALNVVGAPYTQVFHLLTGGGPSDAGHSHLHLEVVSLDPWQQLLTIRVYECRVARRAQTAFTALRASEQVVPKMCRVSNRLWKGRVVDDA